MAFTSYSSPAEYSIVHTESVATDFFNLKNKAEGARQYGYSANVQKAVNAEGTGFRAVYQTTLNGRHYQSGKYSDWVATEAEARALLAKTVSGAMKRYAKLAKDPSSKIELRPLYR